jgi:periplasmic protein TonB
MDRLQQKCVLASASAHVVLALTLVVGPAFVSLTSKPKPDNLEILPFIPARTVDALMMGGGSATAQPPPAPPAPTPPQQSPPDPAPPPATAPERARVPDPTPPRPEPSIDPRARKIETSSALVSRSGDSDAQKKAKADAQAREQARIAARNSAVAAALGQAASTIAKGSSSMAVEMPGPGGGGPTYANFLQAVKSIYANAWIVPDGAADDDATVTASVTIARNGDVVQHRVTRSSGNPAVDRSVQATLEAISHAVPLPEDSKDSQRTVTINFNVRTKRGFG